MKPEEIKETIRLGLKSFENGTPFAQVLETIFDDIMYELAKDQKAHGKSDRETVARKLTIFIYGDVAEWDDLTPEGKELMLEKADQIIALLPDEKDCESCADGFISTHEKATSELFTKVKEARKQERERIQRYIDENSIYRVEFEHYEPPLNVKWIPLLTHKINLKEEIDDNSS